MYRTTQTTTPDQRLSKKKVATLVIGLCALVRLFHSRRSYATGEGREAKVTSVFLPWRPATEIDGALWAFPSPFLASMIWRLSTMISSSPRLYALKPSRSIDYLLRNSNDRIKRRSIEVVFDRNENTPQQRSSDHAGNDSRGKMR